MADSVTDREKSIRAAKLAEQAERYDVMVEEMNKVAKMGEELTVEEMNLLSVGYKNMIGSRRILWRNLSTIKLKVESEIIKIYGDILPIIEEHLIPSISTTEAAVFYYKMKGDAYMYLSEIKTGVERKEAADASCEAYEVATIVAETNLQPADPIRLSLALNHSVFHYVILHETDSACKIGEQAIVEANSGLDRLSKDECLESTITLSIIEQNIKLWKSEMENQDKPDQEEDVKEDGDDYMDVDDENDEDEEKDVDDEKDEDNEKDEDDEKGEDDEKDKDEDPAGGSELNRSEKKSRKAMLKLGMEPVTDVSLVTFKCSKKERLLTISSPDVFKSPKTETYIIFGDVNYKAHLDCEKFVHKAEQAKKDGRYDDMVKEMNSVAIMVEKLTENERNLLSVAYKNAVVPRMESWRILSFLESRSNAVGPLMESLRNLSFEESRSDVREINGDKLKLESEIIKICGDILRIIEEHLIPSISTPVDSLIYYKMKGDYSMYLAELKTGDDKEEYARQCQEAYEAAKLKGAETKLLRAHPYRLGLDLSFSAFFKVVKENPDCACIMAKNAIEEAEVELVRLNDEKAKTESTDILCDLRLLYDTSLLESLGIEMLVEGEKKPDLEDEDADDDAAFIHVSEPVPGVSLVTLKRDNDILFEISTPNVSKMLNTEVYVIFGAGQLDEESMKVGMDPVTDVSSVTMKKTNDMLIEFLKPEVLKNPNAEIYVITGEAKLKDMQGSTAAAQPEK